MRSSTTPLSTELEHIQHFAQTNTVGVPYPLDNTHPFAPHSAPPALRCAAAISTLLSLHSRSPRDRVPVEADRVAVGALLQLLLGVGALAEHARALGAGVRDL